MFNDVKIELVNNKYVFSNIKIVAIGSFSVELKYVDNEHFIYNQNRVKRDNQYMHCL